MNHNSNKKNNRLAIWKIFLIVLSIIAVLVLGFSLFIDIGVLK